MVKTKRKSKAASISKVRPGAGAEQKSITSKPRANRSRRKFWACFGMLRGQRSRPL